MSVLASQKTYSISVTKMLQPADVAVILKKDNCNICKISLCLIKDHAVKICRGVEVQIHAFVTSTLDEG